MYKAFFDGACSGNPGPMAGRYIIFDAEDKVVKEFSMDLGQGTNNIAEYSALIVLLGFLEAEFIEDVQIHGDSKLVVNQVLKKWQINEPHLSKLAMKVWKLMGRHLGWTLQWVPRESNPADAAR